jgi:hypothetical protein
MDRDVILHALRSTVGPQWDEIPHRHKNDEELLITAVLYEKGAPFDGLPEHLQKRNKDVALFGIRHGKIQPDDCELDDEVYKGAIEDGEINWSDLPSHLRRNVDFAMDIELTSAYSEKLPSQILQHVEQLRSNQSFWKNIAVENRYSFSHLLSDYATSELLSDQSFMLKMCGKDEDVFPLARMNLRIDRNFLELAIKENPRTLKHFSHHEQQEHKDIVLKAIKSMTRNHLISTAIYPPYWRHSDIVSAWISAGFGFPSGALDKSTLRAWKRNRQLCLLNAIKTKSMYHCEQYANDVKFMWKVVEAHPNLYIHAKGAARTSVAVMTICFAKCPNIASTTLLEMHAKGQDETIQKLVICITKALKLYETFQNCVLMSMLSNKTFESTGSPLSLLNQGPETSLKYKRLLADYLLVPRGKHLQRFRDAKKHVDAVISQWEKVDDFQRREFVVRL